ncbi:hypothetical protein [Dyella nitratireducens]|uniref:DUF3592 domain-containing protein n=1 Tax=Dyella nitratireducens TaxID=1849580 RepID=A0ABQ1FP63_9GAMM|nr:hypothetical protein [Dyella nitratireducens]GGA24894.1 hypothetical protein GCM10010981_11720 [Dyella nitratireducens]GLQ43766.1 hypothetical protein GCM10007902_36160 [Dyella nitratireducens]
MSWGDGLLDYYARTRRIMFWLWVVFSVLLFPILMGHVLPFSHGSVTSTGVVVARSGCGSKGAFSYTYRYEVGDQVYTGETQWGGFDGNGTCQELVPGAVVPITYRTDMPSRSMSGTVHTYVKMLVHAVLGVGILLFLVVPFFSYLREQRSSR